MEYGWVSVVVRLHLVFDGHSSCHISTNKRIYESSWWVVAYMPKVLKLLFFK